MDELVKRLALLGTCRVSVVHLTWLGLRLSAPHDAQPLEVLSDHAAGLKCLAISLGLRVDVKDLFPYGLADDNMAGTLYRNSLGPDPLGTQIESLYGKRPGFAYNLAVFATTAQITSEWWAKVTSSAFPKGRTRFRTGKTAEAHKALTETAYFYRDNASSIEYTFGRPAALICKSYLTSSAKQQPSHKYFRRLNALSSDLLNTLIPDYPAISERIERARLLEKELTGCPPGARGWRQYEDICFKALTFLLVPPFRHLSQQVRSEGNFERRDCLLKNEGGSQFWAAVRHEFDSKHVVFEFKNSERLRSKDALNQLRIYLSKPTIGRFGILLIRSSPGRAVLQARRDAYEQGKVLVLIVDDTLLKSLMIARAFLGRIDEHLGELKSAFEVTY